MQTTDQLVAYYADLLIYQYISQTRAYATVFGAVEPVLMTPGFSLPLTDDEGNPVVDNEGNWVYSGFPGPLILPLALQDAFNFPGAIGVQLDVLAKYLGGQRTNTLLTGLPYTLDDGEFTQYLQLLALRNGLPSDLNSIQSFVFNNFQANGQQILFVFDYTSMQMSFVYTAVSGTYPVFEAFITSGHLTKPMSVGAAFVYNPTNRGFFSFRTYTQPAQPGTFGFNFYSNPQEGTFSSYAFSINVPFS